MTRGWAVGVVVSIALATACSGGSSSPGSSTGSSTGATNGQTSGAGESPDGLVFGPCGDLLDQVALAELPADRTDRLTFECGVLEVPLDHDSPDGERIGIQVVRIRDSEQNGRIGSLVMNPGGPGQSGLDYAASWASWLSDEVLARFDVVTFDPRGVGASAGFNCPPIPQDDESTVLMDLLSTEGWAYAVEVNRARAESCLTELGADRAPFVSTGATARDLDLLRAALGDDQLTYLGFSYGAKLGAEYARRFPGQIRALVLDGPSDPRGDPIDVVERQTAAFEASFAAWAADCPQRPSCERLGDPRELLDTVLARARKFPIPSGRPGNDLPATDTTVMTGLLALLGSEDSWPWLDDALAEAALGDSGTLQEAIEQRMGGESDPDVPEAGDAGFVINCTDAAPGPSKGDLVRAARGLAEKFPVFGTTTAWWLVGCKFWTGERQVLAVPEAVGAPPIVVVGTRGDPQTPYSGAVAMARILGSGHLLTWDGRTHTAYGQTPCITEAVDAYLVDLVVPDEGTVCPA